MKVIHITENNRVLEIELRYCEDCPYRERCNAYANKAECAQFADDCPLPWHEKGYDRTAELEAEIAMLKERLNKDKWIPVESGIKPAHCQEVLVQYVTEENLEFISELTYMGRFDYVKDIKAVAWRPSPELYKPKEKRALPDKLKEAIMNHFVRVE